MLRSVCLKVFTFKNQMIQSGADLVWPTPAPGVDTSRCCSVKRTVQFVSLSSSGQEMGYGVLHTGHWLHSDIDSNPRKSLPCGDPVEWKAHAFVQFLIDVSTQQLKLTGPASSFRRGDKGLDSPFTWMVREACSLAATTLNMLLPSRATRFTPCTKFQTKPKCR